MIEHVLDELQRARRRALHGRGPVPGPDTRAAPRSTSACRRSSTRPWRTASLATRSGIPAPGAHPGLGGGAGQRGRGDPGRGGRAAALQPSRSRYSDYNRVTGSLRQPGSVMKPLVYLAAFRRPDARCHGARRAHQRAGGLRRAPASSGSPTTTTSSRARSPLARRWPSPATRSRSGSPRPSASSRSSGPAGSWASTRRCSPTSPRRSARPRCGCSSWRAPIGRMASGVLAEPHVVARVTDAPGRSSTKRRERPG